MKESVEISKEKANYLRGKKMDGIRYFNPVLNANGKWCISKGEQEMCKGPEFNFLKTLPKKEHKSIQEATDLSDVFDSYNIDDETVDAILEELAQSNSLTRKDIRFRGVKPSSNSVESRKKLFSEGSILLYSKK